jgi:GT2 family glycosyltransferase
MVRQRRGEPPMPRVSVLMPVRDGARWLDEAVASIRRQTFDDFEFVAIDDGSVDGSADILESHARSDCRIRMIRQARLGLVAALNRGLTEAHGRLIARIDADDRAHPQRLERQTRYLDAHPEIGLVGCWADKIDEHGLSCRPLKPETEPDRLAAVLLRRNPFVHSSVLMRRDIVEKVGGYRAAFEAAEDYDLWLRIAEVTKVANLPELLVQYRWHSRNATCRAQIRQLFSARLAQMAARERRATGRDPMAEVNAPPGWQAAELAPRTLYRELVPLFRLLDLADPSIAKVADIGRVDLSPLRDRQVRLNHAERRMAQLALLNLIRGSGGASWRLRTALLFYFVRLQPLRALELGYQAIR